MDGTKDDDAKEHAESDEQPVSSALWNELET